MIAPPAGSRRAVPRRPGQRRATLAGAAALALVILGVFVAQPAGLVPSLDGSAPLGIWARKVILPGMAPRGG